MAIYKKYKNVLLIGFSLVFLAGFSVFAQFTPSPGTCLVGHEAPKPRDYKLDLVEKSDQPFCVPEDGIIKCRYPVNPDGTLGATEILQRICNGSPSLVICSEYGVAGAGCSITRIGPQIRDWSPQLIKLQGLLEKVSDVFKFSPGNIIVSKNPVKTEYVNKYIYPAAPEGQEVIPVAITSHVWKLSENDKRILGKVNKYLPIIAEKEIARVEKHEEEHCKIMKNALPRYLNVINNLTSLFLGPFQVLTLDEAKEAINSNFKTEIEQEQDNESSAHDAFHKKEYKEESYFSWERELPGFDNPKIACAPANDYVFLIGVYALSSDYWKKGVEIKGTLDVSPNSIKCTNQIICEGREWKDTEITLTAKPSSNGKFVKWTALDKGDYCPCEGSTNLTCKFILQKSIICRALFQ